MSANDRKSAKSPEAKKPPSKDNRPRQSADLSDLSSIETNEDLKVIHHGPSPSTASTIRVADRDANANDQKVADVPNRDSSRCSCCEKVLYSGANCMPTIPKANVCSSCDGYVCKHCKGECHECIVRKYLVLEPEAMMQLERKKLIGFLQMLHYPKHHFDSWEKQYLVKQIFTRFNIHQNWNPRPTSVVKPGDGAKASQPNLNGENPQETKGKETARKEDEPTLRRRQTEKPGAHAGYGSKTRKYKSEYQLKSHPQSIFYDTQVSPATDPVEEPPAKRPGDLKQSKNPDSANKSPRKSKSIISGAYQDMKLLVDISDVLPATEQQKPPASKTHPDPAAEQKEKKLKENPRVLSEATAEPKVSRQGSRETGHSGGERRIATADVPCKPTAHTPKTHRRTDSPSNASSPTRQRKAAEVSKMVSKLDYSLRDISCLKDIEDLRSKQMKAILRRHSIDTKSFADEQEMRYAIIRMWHYKREKENEALVTESMEEIDRIGKAKQNLQANKQQSASESQLNREVPAKDKTRRSKPPEARPAVPRLETVSSAKRIEEMDSLQLAGIMRNHNLNPDNYGTKRESVFAVTCLWNAVHAGTGYRETPKTTSTSKKRANPSEPTAANGSIKKALSISDVRSVVELEKLTVQEMKTILSKYSVDTGKYTEKHELYYAILLLWNSKRGAAKDVKKDFSTSITAAAEDHAKNEYVKSWLLRHDDIAVPGPTGQSWDAKMGDNRAAIEHLNAQQNHATQQVIERPATPKMGTQLDFSRTNESRQSATEDIEKSIIPKADAKAGENRLRTQDNEAAPVTESKPGARNKKAKDFPRDAAKAEEYPAVFGGQPADGKPQNAPRHEAAGAATGAQRVVTKLEKSPEDKVIYTQIFHGPPPPRRDTHSSSIISFGDRIAPPSTEQEFAYIDDTLSEMSVNQGTRNDRMSTTSSYYSKLFQ